MNPYHFFEFLEDREGREIPLTAKLLDPAYEFNLRDFSDWQGNVSFRDIPSSKIPSNLHIKKNLFMKGEKIKEVPSNLQVDGNLSLNNTSVQKLPSNLEVGGDLTLTGSPIKELPPDLKVGGSLTYMGRLIEEIPSSIEVGGDLHIQHTTLGKILSRQLYLKEISKEDIKKMFPRVKGKIFVTYGEPGI